MYVARSDLSADAMSALNRSSGRRARGMRSPQMWIRGSVSLGGRRVPVERPRMRAADGSGEVACPPTSCSVPPNCWGGWRWTGCWPGCRRGATGSGWSRSGPHRAGGHGHVQVGGVAEARRSDRDRAGRAADLTGLDLVALGRARGLYVSGRPCRYNRPARCMERATVSRARGRWRPGSRAKAPPSCLATAFPVGCVT